MSALVTPNLALNFVDARAWGPGIVNADLVGRDAQDAYVERVFGS